MYFEGQVRDFHGSNTRRNIRADKLKEKRRKNKLKQRRDPQTTKKGLNLLMGILQKSFFESEQKLL